MENRGLLGTVQYVDPLQDESEEESEFEEEEDDGGEAEEEEEYDDDDHEEEEDHDDDDDDDDDEEATDATVSSPLRGEISGNAAKRGEGSKLGEEWNREEMEGLVCPICFEAWSNGGEHYPSCLPCGHLYGMSCIRKWLGQQRSRNRCPQCKTKCRMNDVRRIYGSRVIVHDDAELQMRVQSLEAKCKSFEKKDADWGKKEAEWLRREAYLHMHLNKKKARKQGRFSGAQGSQEQSSVDSDADPRDLLIEAELHLRGGLEEREASSGWQSRLFGMIGLVMSTQQQLLKRMDALEQRFKDIVGGEQQLEQRLDGVEPPPPQ